MISKADLSKIIPDNKKSIAAGGIQSLGPMRDNITFKILESIAKKYEFSLHDPIAELPEEALDLIIYGSDELFRIGGGGAASHMVNFSGVISRIEQTERDSDDLYLKKERFIEEIVCPVCNGNRLREESLNFRIDNKNIVEVAAMDIDVLADWVASLESKLDEKQKLIAKDIIKELKDRIGFLLNVGLGYLSLDRATKSLSGGESQRIRLATQIGSKLVNVLYILDEPSIGLHQRDNLKLISSLKNLRDEGNSVIVVEHDEEMIRSGDWLIDLGPGAGEKGGRLLYSGEPNAIEQIPNDQITKMKSLSLEYLKGIRTIVTPTARRSGNGKFLELKGAAGNNLKSVDIKIPLGCFVGISGVSGSGKSSLINETLMPVLSNHFYRSHYKALPYNEIIGIENIDKLIEIDQTPIGRTPRSNPATYTALFGDIRKLFEETPDAGDILYLMAKKPTTKQTKPNQVVNRRARFDYQLGEEIVAGIVLTGQEVRAARDGHVQLKGAFVSIRSGELWLNNASFSLKLNQKGQANARTVDTAARKLLASRRQIEHFMAAKDRGMTIVPTKLLTSGNFIKIVIALAKGKKNYDKRETIKRRDQDRETKRLLARR
jgi:excinuclease ABC subunit A